MARLQACRFRVSHEWTYQYVYANQGQGGTLWQHLRCQKQHGKRYDSNDQRGQLTNAQH